MVEVRTATIVGLSGPVLHARGESDFVMNEAVEVGPDRLLGEVVRIEGRTIVVQVYEDTTGLRYGDELHGTGQPLAVSLGPGLLGGIFDGLLRPLAGTGSDYMRPGREKLQDRQFDFEPLVRPGVELAPGAVFGRVLSGLGKPQLALVPVNAGGRLERIASAGSYGGDAALGHLLGANGAPTELRLTQTWPVREPRPAAERLAPDTPMLTGQRMIDTLFPVARGSTAAMPGGFGTGKTVLLQSIAKWCDADIIIYVGCGERGNEMAEVLNQFPKIEDPRTQRPLLERSVIIANTSNRPVAAREASIYTGVTVAEYFRDQGMHVALMADSTSRWAEALREIGGRLGELPAEGGYPAYLGSRQAEFYERAGRVRSLAGLEGSVTLIGAVSPPGGDFSEPVTLHTQRCVRCFWPLDRDRARARFFPAVSPLQSYSEDALDLVPWWQAQGHTEHAARRRRFLELLEKQAHLARMVRIVGKDALPPSQQITLLCAELVNEAFLRQSAYSPFDCYATPQKQIAMMRVLDRFVDRATQAVARGVPVEAVEGLPVLRRLRRMGDDIANGRAAAFDSLLREVDTSLAAISLKPAAGATRAT